MAIYKQATLPTGKTLGYHQVVKAEADFESGELLAIVASWESRDAWFNGTTWHLTSYPLTFSAFPAVEEALVAGDTPFNGGAIVDEGETDLEAAKAKRWVDVKRWRAESIDSNLVTPYGTLQCTAEDRQNITDSVLLAQTLTAMQQPVSIEWTLADNSVATLDGTQMVTVGLLLGQKVQAAHATARLLRAQIDAATTVAEVEAITWA